MKRFLIVWLGQASSLLGSSLTSFALGVCVFRDSQSISAFAFIGLFTVLPKVFLSPIAGVVVDRFDRKRVMILSDSGSGICTLLLAGLALSGTLELWHIYSLVALSAASASMQWPAYMASIPMLVSKEKLGRANGFVQLAFAFGEILAPPLAAFLLSRVDLAGIIFTDCVTFVFAVATLLCVRFPASLPHNPATETSLFAGMLAGLHFIAERRGLAGLLAYSSASRFFWGLVAALITPMILFFASPNELGFTLGIAGIGMFAGSLLMSVWGGPIPRVRGIVGFEIVSGLAFFLIGIQASIPFVAGGVFLAHITIAVIEGSNHSIWQAKVPRELQGRVFSVQQMALSAASPVAYLLAGPLAEGIFEPLFRADGAFTETVGRVLGTGAGRGIGLIFVLMGVVKILIGLAMRASRQVWSVERELPDEGYTPG